MQEPDRVAAIFANAWALYADAIEILELGKSRIAGEVAWGATKRAADALILARTGREPSGTGRTSAEMNSLGRRNNEVAPISSLYKRRILNLHGRCFYLGICEDTEILVRDTADFIRDAERLAGASRDDLC